jgi:hypothetical protein
MMDELDLLNFPKLVLPSFGKCLLVASSRLAAQMDLDYEILDDER